MKKILTLIISLVVTLSAQAQQATVVHINKAIKLTDLYYGHTMEFEPDIYMCEHINGDTIMLPIRQDAVVTTVDKIKQFKTSVWTAAQGHGYVYGDKDTYIRTKPTEESKVIAQFGPSFEDSMPLNFACLGMKGDWYKISLLNPEFNTNAPKAKHPKIGYVHKNYVTWRLGDFDCAGCIR